MGERCERKSGFKVHITGWAIPVTTNNSRLTFHKIVMESNCRHCCPSNHLKLSNDRSYEDYETRCHYSKSFFYHKSCAFVTVSALAQEKASLWLAFKGRHHLLQRHMAIYFLALGCFLCGTLFLQWLK